MRRTLSLTVVVSIIASLFHTSSCAAGDDVEVDPRIGPLGDARRVDFVGNKFYSATQIRNALERDLELQAMASPSAPLQGYAQMLAERIGAGYSKGGFARPEIHTEVDPAKPRVIVTIVEGERSFRGPVQLSGAKSVPIDRLADMLTTAQEPDVFSIDMDENNELRRIVTTRELDQDHPKAIWKVGDPASLDKPYLADLQRALLTAFCKLGYVQARFTYAYKPHGNRMTLAVQIQDEGEKASIADITIAGLKKITPEQLQKYLNINKGEPVDLALLHGIHQRLWDSARFKKAVICAEPIAEKQPLMHLKLELEENPEAPPLNASFTPAEQAMLKLREWLLGLQHSDRDLVFDGVVAAPLRPSRYQIIFGADRGIAFHYLATDIPRGGVPGATQPTTAPTTQSQIVSAIQGLPSWLGDEAGFSVAAGAVGIYLPAQRLKFVVHQIPEINLSFWLLPTLADDGTTKWGVNFNADTVVREPARPVSTELHLAPASFVHLAHLAGYAYDVRDGVLTMTGQHNRVKIDAVTGELREIASDAGGTVRVVTQQGALTACIAQMNGQPGVNDALEPRRPYASALSVAANLSMSAYALVHQPASPQRDLMINAYRKLLTTRVFEPLEETAQEQENALHTKQEDRFDIPATSDSETGDYAWLRSYVSAMMPVLNGATAHGSWPWTLSRETMLLLCGHTEAFSDETQRILRSRETGPVGDLAAAALLHSLDRHTSRVFARVGLMSLTADDLARDCRVVLDPATPSGQVLIRLAENLRDLSSQEVDAIAAGLPPDTGKLLRDLHTGLTSHRDQPIAGSLDVAIRQAWIAGLNRAVRERLQSLVSKK